MMVRHWFELIGGLVLWLTASAAAAESPRFYNLEGFGEFLDGNPESTAVTEDGAITLPPPARERYSDAATTFSAAAALGDEIIVARVDDGKVLAIDRAGKVRTLYTAKETLVTSLLATSSGLYVAVGSPAKIYRLDDKGRAKLFHTPDAGFIWDMVEGPKGTLLLATGEPGTVVRVDSKGNGTVLFAPEQEHMRSILYDPELGIFAGGGERGVLYRSRDSKTFRALYDSNHPEITAIVVHGNYVFVAGVSGAEALASEPDAETSSAKGKDSVQVNSQLVRVAMDGSAEVMAGSNDEAIFDMAVDAAGTIVVATGATGREDPRGRLYTVQPVERKIAMAYQAPSRRITHLVRLPRDAMAAIAADGARIIHLAGGIAKEGTFLTLPFDTGINSRYGNVQIFGTISQGTRVSAALRTGQTSEPDDSWSEWSKEIQAPGGECPPAPNGRYFQLRLRLMSDGKQAPEVHRVRLAYLRQNLPPFVREVVALRKGLALFPLPVEKPKSKTVSLADKASKEMRRSDDSEQKNNSVQRARQIEEHGALTVKWLAEDPNGDELSYELSFRTMGKRAWHQLKGELDEPFYTINSTQLPDGHYQFRVRASDRPSNPDGHELMDSRDSRTVLIDNTPPRVDPIEVSVSRGRVVARTSVADAVGPITRAEYSIDGKEFRPAIPDDGVLDGAGESFVVRIGVLPAGHHVLTFHVVDEADNDGFGEAQFIVR